VVHPVRNTSETLLVRAKESMRVMWVMWVMRLGVLRQDVIG